MSAYYSQARESKKVPVDYTLVKHVKKIPGGRPGMVTYTDYKTIIAEPSEELVKRLKGNCVDQFRMHSECKILGKRVIYAGIS